MLPDYCGTHGRCKEMRSAQDKKIIVRTEAGWFFNMTGDMISIRSCPWCGWQLPKSYTNNRMINGIPSGM
jgi:hypothetical protein